MNKYRNQKIVVDGIMFDSKKEAKRYQFLKALERAGEIKNLKTQVPFELQPAFRYDGKGIRAIKYIADFTYYARNKDGRFILVVEDTKGYRTKEYELKKKLFLFTQGFPITEV